MEAFISAIENSLELQEKVIAASSCEDLVKVAIAAGYNLTTEELKATIMTSFDEMVIQLDNPSQISSHDARIYLAQLVDLICFSS